METKPRSLEAVSELAYVLGFSRDWHHREQCRAPLHPAVAAAFALASPIDWHEVVLQWPHKSGTDAGRLAYTQDEKKAQADLQTVTSIGKYLTRHFRSLPDHVIRGLAHRFTVEGVEIRSTSAEIVEACQKGPKSCMQWEDWQVRDNGRGHHPYEAYAPELGWKIAVRMKDGDIIGRALLLDADGHKCFVRTYLMNPGDGYSQRDEAMEEFLREQGYSSAGEWPDGARLAKIHTGRGDAQHLLPYIDGRTQTVSDAGDYFEIEEGGEYECEYTDGTAEGGEREECSHCGTIHRNREDGLYVGRHVDNWVGSCCEDDYTRVYGRNGDEYYIRSNETVDVDGESYDPEYLSDNDIVELDNGDYCHSDNAFHCPVNDAWYHTDDGRYTEDSGTVHEDDTWQCSVTDKWYSTDEESATNADGETVHPDELTEDETPK